MVFTKEQVEFLRVVLRRVNNPRGVDDAISAAVESLGLPAELASAGIGSSASAAAANGGAGPSGKQQGGAAGKRKGESGQGKGRQQPHALSAYTIFVTLVMERIAQDPENPAFKVPEKLDEHGQPVKGAGRGGKMSVASGLWSTLSEQEKSTIGTIFKPLAEELHEESLRTGTKVKDVSARTKDFQQKLPADVQADIKHIFERALAANPKAGAHAAGPSNQAPPSEQPSGETSSSDSEDPEEEKRREEAKRAQAEKDEKKKHKEGKKHKKEKEEGEGGDSTSKKKKKKAVDSE